MKAVPSTYHQCIKFSYNDIEVTIPGDPNPFQYCASLRETTSYQILENNEAKPIDSSKWVDAETILSKAKAKMKIEDNGCGEYLMSQAFHIGKLPLSPKSYGKPQSLQVQQSTTDKQKTTFPNYISGSGTHEEHIHKNISICINKDKQQQEARPISPDKYGRGFAIMQKHGYDGCSGLGLQKQGITEPITTIG